MGVFDNWRIAPGVSPGIAFISSIEYLQRIPALTGRGYIDGVGFGDNLF